MSANKRSAPTFAKHTRHENLEVAHGGFLGIVSARVGMQAGTALRRHADEMRALVQYGMERRIEARMELRADQTCLPLSPMGTGYHLARGHQHQIQPEPVEQHQELETVDGIEQKHTVLPAPVSRGRPYFNRVSRCMAIATRSRAICARRMSASCSLASSTFSSKL